VGIAGEVYGGSGGGGGGGDGGGGGGGGAGAVAGGPLSALNATSGGQGNRRAVRAAGTRAAASWSKARSRASQWRSVRASSRLFRTAHDALEPTRGLPKAGTIGLCPGGASGVGMQHRVGGAGADGAGEVDGEVTACEEGVPVAPVAPLERTAVTGQRNHQLSGKGYCLGTVMSRMSPATCIRTNSKKWTLARDIVQLLSDFESASYRPSAA